MVGFVVLSAGGFIVGLAGGVFAALAGGEGGCGETGRGDAFGFIGGIRFLLGRNV